MSKGKDTRRHPNRNVSRSYFEVGEEAAREGQLPLMPSGISASEENTWMEGYDYGEYKAGVPSDSRNVYPRGQ
jgi:hypothetical protein